MDKSFKAILNIQEIPHKLPLIGISLILSACNSLVKADVKVINTGGAACEVSVFDGIGTANEIAGRYTVAPPDWPKSQQVIEKETVQVTPNTKRTRLILPTNQNAIALERKSDGTPLQIQLDLQQGDELNIFAEGRTDSPRPGESPTFINQIVCSAPQTSGKSTIIFNPSPSKQITSLAFPGYFNYNKQNQDQIK